MPACVSTEAQDEATRGHAPTTLHVPTLALPAGRLMELRGKVVVVTGAASGIGEALAQQLAALGARLVLCDVDGVLLQSVVGALGLPAATVIAKVVDVADEAALQALAQRVAAEMGGADIVINNAGVALSSSIEGMTMADAHWLMNINFWGVVHGCRAFLPQLRLKPQALVVNLSSIFAMVSMPTQSIYNASKAAVRGFSDALRLELSDSAVGVLCVHPGGIRTRIAELARVGDIALMKMSADEMRSNFELKLARTSAAEAARQIVRAIERDRTRLLIGGDAWALDLLVRLFPRQASGWVRAMARRQHGRP